MKVWIILSIIYLIYSINAEQEHNDLHMLEGKNAHDSKFDHEAILGKSFCIELKITFLGSKHMVEEFNDLSEDESKRRLKILAEQQMDSNKDKIVTLEELSDYVYNSLVSLDKEETEERFIEIDTG